MINFDTEEEQILHERLVHQANRVSLPNDLRARVEASQSSDLGRGFGSRALLIAACLLLVGGVAAWAATSGRGATESALSEGFGTSLLLEADDRFCGANPPETTVQVLIWMVSGADSTDIEGVDAYLAESTSVDSFRFVNSQETYKEFEQFWTESPEVLDLVHPEDLPTSFRVRVSTGTDSLNLVPDLKQMDGVLKVETVAHTC